MTVSMKTRATRRLVAACAIATAIGGGLGLAAAPAGADPARRRVVPGDRQDRGRPDRVDRAGGLRGQPARSADGAGRSAQRAASPTPRRRSRARGRSPASRSSRPPRTTAATVARVRVALVSPVGLQGPQRPERDPPRARARSRRRRAPRRRCPSVPPAPRPAGRRHDGDRGRDHASTRSAPIDTRTSTTVTLAGNGRLVALVAHRVRRPAAPPRARLPERRRPRRRRAPASTASSSSRSGSRSTAASRW